MGQTFVVEKIESLLIHGHEVVVFTWESDPPSVLHEVFDRIDWRERTIVLGTVHRGRQLPKIGRLLTHLRTALVRVPAALVRGPRDTLTVARRMFFATKALCRLGSGVCSTRLLSPGGASICPRAFHVVGPRSERPRR